MAKRYTAELKAGTTLMRKGVRHRRGLAIGIDPSEVQSYRNSGRFVVSEVDDRPRPQSAEGGRRRRSRAETRSREVERAQTAPVTPPAPAPKAPAPASKPVSSERLAKLAEADVSAKLPRPTLEKMATQLEAKGPKSEGPDDAPNKPTLVKWIQQRQGEVLAELQGDLDGVADYDDPDVEDGDLVPDGDDEDADSLVPDGDDEE